MPIRLVPSKRIVAGSGTGFATLKVYVKELTNPVNMKNGSNDNKEVFTLMQAYYQSERALPPADKSLANTMQAMMMMRKIIIYFNFLI